ncbi:MAG: serine dehydratase subunit alpha family protein [Rikenellaceae bacterium]|nr:serine dehydratase subunit alpha family protein [Rikenellaceae bacterium]
MNYSQINTLLHREVVPAIGCTEPIAVSLCVARACEVLGSLPERIVVNLSPNIYKNAMGVGIPNTGMTGLPIAVALGAIAGKSEYELEVLKDADSAAVERAKSYLESTDIKIDIDRQTTQMLYICVEVYNGENSAKAIISGTHTNFTYISRNGEVSLSSEGSAESEQAANDEPQLTLNAVYKFATTVDLSLIEWLEQAEKLNIAAAEVSFTGDYGHGLGRLMHNGATQSILGNTLFTKILSYTSGACDARMSGAMVPVMSNSGSGNQGISATVPVVIFGRETGVSRDKLLRALALSHLTVVYIKQSLGRLSALCGCVVAATGSSCGITYLMGGEFREVCFAVKNMVANLTGMICDGAKPSCSLKVTSGVSTAVLSAVLAIEQRHTTSLEGIIDDDVDKCIANLTNIGRNGMRETDKLILKIMTEK